MHSEEGPIRCVQPVPLGTGPAVPAAPCSREHERDSPSQGADSIGKSPEVPPRRPPRGVGSARGSGSAATPRARSRNAAAPRSGRRPLPSRGRQGCHRERGGLQGAAQAPGCCCPAWGQRGHRRAGPSPESSRVQSCSRNVYPTASPTGPPAQHPHLNNGRNGYVSFQGIPAGIQCFQSIPAGRFPLLHLQ